MRSWGRAATAHPLVAHLMWLGWEPVVKITVPLEWTLLTVINAVAWGSQQRAQLLQRPCMTILAACESPASATQRHAHSFIYVLFQEDTQSNTHCCLLSDIIFFINLNTFVGRKKQLIKSFYSVSATRLLVSSTCVLRTILFIAYTYWSLCSMSAFNDVTPIKKVSKIQGACICTCRGMWPAIDSLRISSATVAGCKHDFIKSRNKGWGLVFCVSFIFQYVYTSDWICTDFVIHSHTIPPQLPHLCPSTSETA